MTLKQGEILGTLEPVKPLTAVGVVNALETSQNQKVRMEIGERLVRDWVSCFLS